MTLERKVLHLKIIILPFVNMLILARGSSSGSAGAEHGEAGEGQEKQHWAGRGAGTW